MARRIRSVVRNAGRKIFLRRSLQYLLTCLALLMLSGTLFSACSKTDVYRVEIRPDWKTCASDGDCVGVVTLCDARCGDWESLNKKFLVSYGKMHREKCDAGKDHLSVDCKAADAGEIKCVLQKCEVVKVSR